jgi:hypothetical protein
MDNAAHLRELAHGEGFDLVRLARAAPPAWTSRSTPSRATTPPYRFDTEATPQTISCCAGVEIKT